MNKNKKKKTIWAIGAILAVVACVLIAIIVGDVLGGKNAGKITVEYSGKLIGLKCTDTMLTHPTMLDSSPVSFINSITANFQNDKLLSIMYQYDGTYKNSEAARAARDFAAADYNLILSNEYGVKIDIFSHLFRNDGEKMTLTITADGDRVTGRTAPYFLLDVSESFPKTLDELKDVYLAKNFSCETTE